MFNKSNRACLHVLLHRPLESKLWFFSSVHVGYVHGSLKIERKCVGIFLIAFNLLFEIAAVTFLCSKANIGKICAAVKVVCRSLRWDMSHV